MIPDSTFLKTPDDDETLYEWAVGRMLYLVGIVSAYALAPALAVHLRREYDEENSDSLRIMSEAEYGMPLMWLSTLVMEQVTRLSVLGVFRLFGRDGSRTASVVGHIVRLAGFMGSGAVDTIANIEVDDLLETRYPGRSDDEDIEVIDSDDVMGMIHEDSDA